ncbi:MAG: pyridoxal-phosphate dependent enzyme [Acetobacteraceae bacterium]|jgi:1-aminocyclopropane-1-carboxylate deaminase/D-cysteine desulfhydrase-like pyridoxal-dependent ACC family enzyme|nr:pyridoxal-phosphate dependent enzyme [Acetobacteraceae bacterium]
MPELFRPTPLEPAPRLAAALGLGALWVKREDLAGTAFGGNKLRQISLLLADARAAGADTVITTAASQSNFCRALAGSAARAGLGCALLLRRAGGAAMQGNLLLDHVFGARVAWTDATDPWDPAIDVELESLAGILRAEGKRPAIIRLPGRSAALAASAWARGAAELAADLAAAGATADVVTVACGSALTASGLALGLPRAGIKARVLGVSVQQPVSRLRPWCEDVMERTAELLGWPCGTAAERLLLTEDQIAPGYGRPSDASLAAVRLAGRSEGLVLDPVYTGKALAGLAAAVGETVPRGCTAVFIHSGGAPSLFLHAAALGDNGRQA